MDFAVSAAANNCLLLLGIAITAFVHSDDTGDDICKHVVPGLAVSTPPLTNTCVIVVLSTICIPAKADTEVTLLRKILAAIFMF